MIAANVAMTDENIKTASEREKRAPVVPMVAHGESVENVALVADSLKAWYKALQEDDATALNVVRVILDGRTIDRLALRRAARAVRVGDDGKSLVIATVKYAITAQVTEGNKTKWLALSDLLALAGVIMPPSMSLDMAERERETLTALLVDCKPVSQIWEKKLTSAQKDAKLEEMAKAETTALLRADALRRLLESKGVSGAEIETALANV